MVVCERLDEQWGIQFGGVLRQSLKGWVLFAAEAVRPRLASASRTRRIEAIKKSRPMMVQIVLYLSAVNGFGV
jgi:hypothetical protein